MTYQVTTVNHNYQTVIYATYTSMQAAEKAVLSLGDRSILASITAK